MTTFKAGDKVELAENYSPFVKGDKVTVVGDSRGSFTTVRHDDGRDATGYHHRFKPVEEPITHGGIKIGDKVRYTPSLWNGMEGTVHRFNNGYVDVMVTKLPDNADKYSSLVLGKTVCQTVGGQGISPSALEVVPEEKPFTYKDIQKGDKIRRTRTYPSGSVEIREGVVGHIARDYVSDGKTFILAYDSDDTPKAKGTLVLELLERPEPPKAPEPWDNAKTGDVLFRVDKIYGTKDTFVKKADGGWTIFYPDGSADYQISAEESLSGYFIGTECVAVTAS